MSTIEKFEKAKAYREMYYPSDGEVAALDFWYENIFYGRIDRESNAICFKDTQLKQLPSQLGTIFAANFVVDAFKDLRRYCRKAAAHGKIESGGAYGTLHAAAGWQSPTSLYHSHMETLMQEFAFYFSVGKRKEKILSFKDFVQQFINFTSSIVPRVPVTKTGFLLSRYCPPHVSGLVIELDDKTILRNNLDKKTRFINDPNFLFIRKAAKKFGFYIDKNAPWTLVANVFSGGEFMAPPFESQPQFEPEVIESGMLPYINEYNLTPDEVFDTMYFRSFEGDQWRDGANSDIELLRYYLLQFYNTLLAAEPYIHKSSVCVGSYEVKTKQVKIKRQSLGQIGELGELPFMYKKKFGDLFWLRTFLNLRMLEQNISHGFNDIFLESKYVLKREGLAGALSLINEKTNGFRRTNFNTNGAFWQGYSIEEKNPTFVTDPTTKTISISKLPLAETNVSVQQPIVTPSAPTSGGSSGY